jgi:hypothetical protein
MTDKKEISTLEGLSNTSLLVGVPLLLFPQKWAKNNYGLIWASGVILSAFGAVGSVISAFSKKEDKKEIEQPTQQNNLVIIPQVPFEVDSNQKKDFLATIKPQSLHDYAQNKTQSLEK